MSDLDLNSKKNELNKFEKVLKLDAICLDDSLFFKNEFFSENETFNPVYFGRSLNDLQNRFQDHTNEISKLIDDNFYSFSEKGSEALIRLKICIASIDMTYLKLEHLVSLIGLINDYYEKSFLTIYCSESDKSKIGYQIEVFKEISSSVEFYIIPLPNNLSSIPKFKNSDFQSKSKNIYDGYINSVELLKKEILNNELSAEINKRREEIKEDSVKSNDEINTNNGSIDFGEWADSFKEEWEWFRKKLKIKRKIKRI